MYCKSVLSMKVVSIVAAAFTLFPLNASASNENAANTQAARCADGGAEPAIKVLVENIKSVEGNLRAQIYSSNPEDFLEKGKKLVRVDVPVVEEEGMEEGTQYVCVPVPAAGTYALVVMHDRNANGKADFFTEGFGFSNNPKLRLAPPDAEDVMITVPDGVLETAVKLKYILGSSEEKEKRRKLKRR